MPGRRFHSATARALVLATSAPDAQAAMVLRVEGLLAEVGVDAPPVDLRIVGSFVGVRDVQLTTMTTAGRLLPDNGGYIIQVNAHHGRGKQRFTLAHEIGHLLLPGYLEKRRLIEDAATGFFEVATEEEHLCDIAASELLMPMALFKPEATTQQFTLNAVAELARLFEASREAVARRLIQTELWPCAVAFWHYTHKPSQRAVIRNPSLVLPGFEPYSPEKKLRVRYAVSSKRFGHYLYPHLSAEPDGILSECYANGGVYYGKERIKIRDEFHTFHVTAAAVDIHDPGDCSAGSREVFSLIVWEGAVVPSDPAQLDLWTVDDGFL